MSQYVIHDSPQDFDEQIGWREIHLQDVGDADLLTPTTIWAVTDALRTLGMFGPACEVEIVKPEHRELIERPEEPEEV